MLQEPGDAERVHEVLRSVMEREGIPREPVEPGALELWLSDKFGSLFEGISENSDTLFVVLGLLTLAFMIVLVVAAVRGRRGRWRGRDPRRAEESRAVQRRVEVLRGQARAVDLHVLRGDGRRGGDHRAAPAARRALGRSQRRPEPGGALRPPFVVARHAAGGEPDEPGVAVVGPAGASAGRWIAERRQRTAWGGKLRSWQRLEWRSSSSERWWSSTASAWRG